MKVLKILGIVPYLLEASIRPKEDGNVTDSTVYLLVLQPCHVQYP